MFKFGIFNWGGKEGGVYWLLIGEWEISVNFDSIIRKMSTPLIKFGGLQNFSSNNWSYLCFDSIKLGIVEWLLHTSKGYDGFLSRGLEWATLYHILTQSRHKTTQSYSNYATPTFMLLYIICKSIITLFLRSTFYPSRQLVLFCILVVAPSWYWAADYWVFCFFKNGTLSCNLEIWQKGCSYQNFFLIVAEVRRRVLLQNSRMSD